MRILLTLLLFFGLCSVCLADVTYEKTDDPNIIKRVVTTVTEINLKELKAEIDVLDEQIEVFPEPKTEPDLETLDFYNMMNMDIYEKEDLIRRRDEEQDYLNTLSTAISK